MAHRTDSIVNAGLVPTDALERLALRHSIPHRPSARCRIGSLAFSFVTMASQVAHAVEPAFNCAPLLPSASRTPAYTRVSGEARCEGFFDGTVSQPFIELLSLLRQRPDALPSAASAPLQIQVSGGGAAQIVIQPLAPSPFYRVDAAVAPGLAWRWNATAMLASTGLRLTDLGFLARASLTGPSPATRDGGDTASTALRVLPISLTTAPPTPDDPTVAYAVLRVSVAVGSVAARSYQLGAGAAAGSGWRPLPGTPLDAWDTLVLPVTLPVPSAGPAPDTHVDVRAVDTNGQLLPLLQFVVVGK